MTEDDQPNAKIFRKPIHDKATRKVAALPQLLEKSQRPDGEKADKVDKADADSPVDPASPDLDDGGLFDDVFDD